MEEQNKKENTYNYKKDYKLIIFGVLLLVVLAIFWLLPQFSRAGNLHIDKFEEGMIVFIDDEEIEPVSLRGQAVSFDLDEGERSILVYREGYLPWSKEINIERRDDIRLSPFMVRAEPEIEIIEEGDERYENVIALFEEREEIEEGQARIKSSEDSSIRIALEGSTLFAEWRGAERDIPVYFCLVGGRCRVEIEVLSAQTPIRNFDLFKDRNDVIIFATGEGVYAVETDKRPVQNFQPIYEGTAPDFELSSDRQTLYILDGEILMEVTF